MGPRTGLEECGKSHPTGIRTPDRPARSESLYRLRYPDQQHIVPLPIEMHQTDELTLAIIGG